jgi:hypothetical protein
MGNSEERPSGELIKAGVELVKTAYDDALKPVSKEAGKALGTLGKTVNVALAPLRGLVWSWDRIEQYLSEAVERKLAQRKVPVDRITTPDPDIAVPAVQALTYSKLRENYANLIATAMDKQTAGDAHPAFVEILKQLTADEAKILEFLPDVGRYEPLVDLGYELPEKGTFFTIRNLGTLASDAGCSNPTLLPRFADNLCRLGLTEIPALMRLTEEARYARIRSMAVYEQVKSSIPEGSSFEEDLRMIGLTRLGAAFRKACINEPSSN